MYFSRLFVVVLAVLLPALSAWADLPAHLATLTATRTLPYTQGLPGTAVVSVRNSRLSYAIYLPVIRAEGSEAICEISASTEKFSFRIIGSMGATPIGSPDFFDPGSTGFIGKITAPAWLESALAGGKVAVRVTNTEEDWSGIFDQTTWPLNIELPTLTLPTLAIYEGSSTRRSATLGQADSLQSLKVRWILAADPDASPDAPSVTALLWQIAVRSVAGKKTVEVSAVPSSIEIIDINGTVFVTDHKDGTKAPDRTVPIVTLVGKGKRLGGTRALPPASLPDLLAGTLQVWSGDGNPYNAQPPPPPPPVQCIQDTFTLHWSKAASGAAVGRHETVEQTIESIRAALAPKTAR